MSEDKAHMSEWQLILSKKVFAAHSCAGFAGPEIATHGHTFEVKVCLGASELDEKTGLIIARRDGERLMNVALSEFMHADLNDLPTFQRVQPTSEHLSSVILARVRGVIEEAGQKTLTVRWVEVSDGEVTVRAIADPFEVEEGSMK